MTDRPDGVQGAALTRVVIALGSNVGDRVALLAAAAQSVAALIAGRMTRSALYQTPAMLPRDAPADWNQPFLNAAVSGQTALAPCALLAATQAIERALGRVDRGRWGPREIDLDLLVAGDLRLENAYLTLPHPGLTARAFAAVPLAQLWPDWRHPVDGRTAQAIAAGLDRRDLVALEDPRWR